MPEFFLVVFIIIVALIFDFGNGLNDAANAVSTIVATRVLSPKMAVGFAAAFNFLAAFIFGVAVATTIGKGLVRPEVVNELIILAGLLGAIFWVYLASYLGLPISASHSLIGGFIGSAVVAAGLQAVITSGLLKVVLFIFIAPVLGLIGGFLFSVFIFRTFRKSPPFKVNGYFKKLQLLSAAVYSLGHGTNDAQKTMGIIAILLFTAGYLGGEFYVPFWVIIISHLAIALGTLLGGRRIIKTMGLRITKLKPVNGFCAETSSAGVIIGSTMMGIPVSTTHIISGSIMGVGASRRLSAVRWKIARNIMWAWIITIPVAAVMGGLFYWGISLLV
jgi:PiT family inorganic phosphate transporter